MSLVVNKRHSIIALCKTSDCFFFNMKRTSNGLQYVYCKPILVSKSTAIQTKPIAIRWFSLLFFICFTLILWVSLSTVTVKYELNVSC